MAGGETTASAPGRAPLGLAVALGAGLAGAALLALIPVVMAAAPVTELPDPLPDHHQDAETLLFVLSFAVLAPLGVAGGSRLADRMAGLLGASGLSALCALLCGGTAAVVILLRIADGGSSGVPTAIALAWAAAVAVAVIAVARGRGASWLVSAGKRSEALWAGAAALVLAAALAFTSLGSISVLVLIVGALVVALAMWSRERFADLRAGRWGVAIDAGALLLIALAVPNLVLFPSGGQEEAVQSTVIQFHQNFFLGPANQVLAGHPMLIDTLSQYGVFSIVFLAGLFELIPIGNGTLGLIEGGLSVLMFWAAYAAMRIAGVGRALAITAMAVAVVVLVWGLQYPLGGLLQHGAFRFGLPAGVVLGVVAEARWPEHARPARALALLTLGLASVWALEAFAYTALVYAAAAGLAAALAPAGARLRELGRWAVSGAAACVAAHVLFALTTLITVGELPRWGWYLNTLREFLTGQIGDLTYDFSSFSAGLALGSVLLLSAIAIATLVLRRPDIARRQRPLVAAIVTTTTFGVALFSYIVNRSADHIVPYVALPAVTLAPLWLTLLGRRVVAVPGQVQALALGGALALGVLLVSVAASTVGTRFPESALGMLRPGGDSPRAAVQRLWDRPPLSAGAVDGQRLLEKWMPGETRSSVIASADLAVEILMRTERGSEVPLGDPWEDSFVPEGHLEPLREYADGLAAGDRLLLDARARETYDTLKAEPGRDPLEAPVGGVGIVPSGLVPLQEWVLGRIGERFDLRVLERLPSGLEVVELLPAGDTPGRRR